MTINKKIRPCPQHELGKTTPHKPTYLLRTCPTCMKWLGRHPEDAGLARQFVPGTYFTPLQGAYNPQADKRQRPTTSNSTGKNGQS
jgi:hypothetical protein